MIRTKDDLKLFLREDAKRNGVNTNFFVYRACIWAGLENYHIFRYLKCLRKCEFHLNTKHKLRYLLYRIKLYRLGLRYNIRIPINVCGYGLRIMHIAGGGGILLNAKKIGNYCGFNAGVLLGNKDNVENKPTIGDYVAFGPGSKAFGEITIGTNVFIAPNAVVTKDVPNNVTVGGIPAKIISNKGPWNINQNSTTLDEPNQ